jgi:hypothetical protein
VRQQYANVCADRVASLIFVVASAYIAGGAFGIGIRGRGVGAALASSSTTSRVTGFRLALNNSVHPKYRDDQHRYLANVLRY